MGIEDLFGQGGAGLQQMLEQARRMQEQVKEAQERAKNREVTGEAAGGLVKVIANGRPEIVRVELDKSVIVASEAEMLQDLITAAANDAIRKAQQAMTDELGPLAKMLEMGGLKF